MAEEDKIRGLREANDLRSGDVVNAHLQKARKDAK